MDRSIIIAAAEGDKKAFKTIFELYVPKMRPIALRYARTNFEAEDILQESFLKVYRNLKTFKNDGSFEGWVKRIVVNTALNHYEKYRKDYQQDNFEMMDEGVLGQEDAMEIEEINPSQLLKIVQNLPDGYRLVINLHVLEDYSYKEIAVLMKISEGTVRSQYSKARRYIKKILAELQNKQKTSLINKDTNHK